MRAARQPILGQDPHVTGLPSTKTRAPNNLARSAYALQSASAKREIHDVTFEPDTGNASIYHELFRWVYLKIYPSLRPLYKEIEGDNNPGTENAFSLPKSMLFRRRFDYRRTERIALSALQRTGSS
jgi:hypothetical protein